MSVNFAYNQCLTGTQVERTLEASKVQKFCYSDVSYSQYSKMYEPCSRGANIVKKVIAPISAIGFGVVLSIYHLAKSIFMGIPKMIFAGESKTFKSHFFTAARDVEHGFGWLVTIFNDKYGSYLVEDAQYHKLLYKYFL